MLCWRYRRRGRPRRRRGGLLYRSRGRPRSQRGGLLCRRGYPRRDGRTLVRYRLGSLTGRGRPIICLGGRRRHGRRSRSGDRGRRWSLWRRSARGAGQAFWDERQGSLRHRRRWRQRPKLERRHRNDRRRGRLRLRRSCPRTHGAVGQNAAAGRGNRFEPARRRRFPVGARGHRGRRNPPGGRLLCLLFFLF